MQPEFVEGDIFALDQLGREVDVVFSQGVLEHFGDEEIREIVRQSLAVAPRFVFSVPSKFYGVQDFGNERLMEASDWARILDGLGRVDRALLHGPPPARPVALLKPLMVLGDRRARLQ